MDPVREQGAHAARRIELRSLASNFLEDEHSLYVRHLEEAIKDHRNRNIALTGRYGSGKSSVLDQFEQKHKRKTLRISINTLGPDEDGDDLTNRIQKELVKQIIYRAKPGKLRRSRFARSAPLTPLRAFLQAFALTAIVAGVLWLVGLRPGASWFLGTADPLLKFELGVLLFALVVLILWAIRWIIGDRIISQVSTAGTTIALGERPKSYFDGFLDEIVAFFDSVKPDHVIFEDLDRFDNAQIFDSLRELNTLINASANWKDRKQPLRFIYAIKDSLFERIGKGPETRDDAYSMAGRQQDAAGAAVERANRTKFFELVIPMVPFISHRNARDHLKETLQSLDFSEDFVSRSLLDLVARHATDMRLLINICNEFAVYVEKLLWAKNPAPGMTADDLFALVAYKNFHLADFESIPQRASSLDVLEAHHRDLVRKCVVDLQRKRRSVIHLEEVLNARAATAQELGERLLALKDSLAPLAARLSNPHTHIEVGGNHHAFDAVTTVAFWTNVATAGSLTLGTLNAGSGVTLAGTHLSQLFPTAEDPDYWRDADPEDRAEQVATYDRDIAKLRGADFRDLARYESVPASETPFMAQIAVTLKSELARDLVLRGFLTRNYAEYSATFYGSFIGVDVAFFYNHSVQPNQMYLDYEFTTPNAVRNLLEQVPSDFSSTVSVYNVQVMAHLLKHETAMARHAVAFLVSDHNSDAQTFLEAFLNAPEAPGESLVRLLAEHPWPGLFDYLASNPRIPGAETRRKLFDTALGSGDSAAHYDLDSRTQAFLVDVYPQLDTFRLAQPPGRTQTIFSFANACGLVVADLSAIAAPLRVSIVNAEMYELTVANLQLALDIQDAPTLDEVRKKEAVWRYCKENLESYLAAMESESPDDPIVRTEAALAEVITEQIGAWPDEQLITVIRGSDPDAALGEITAVPESAWPLVAGAGRLVPTAGNISAYVEANGVDDHLRGLLAPSHDSVVQLKEVDAVDLVNRENLATRILNARVLPASVRVRLAAQLDLPDGVHVEQLSPTSDGLLGHLLQAGLVPDDVATFTYFANGGLRAVSSAFAISQNMGSILTPALVSGFVAALVESDEVPETIRTAVVEDLASYVPTDDVAALRAAGKYAGIHRIELPLDQVARIASNTGDPDAVLPHLVRANDMSADDLIGVLILLGEPYNLLMSPAGTEFSLPAGSSNSTLLDRLVAAGKVAIVKERAGAGMFVRNLV